MEWLKNFFKPTSDEILARNVREAADALEKARREAEAKGLTVLLRHGDNGYNSIFGSIKVSSIARQEWYKL